MKYSDTELKFIVERIDKQQYALTEWEQGFFKTVKALVEADKPLSAKQAECLSKIWDRMEEA